jgi:hypothetical protein
MFRIVQGKLLLLESGADGQLFGSRHSERPMVRERCITLHRIFAAISILTKRSIYRYNDCRKAIEDRRNRLANAEARQWENRRKPVLVALAKQLAELQALAATKTNRDLIAVRQACYLREISRQTGCSTIRSDSISSSTRNTSPRLPAHSKSQKHFPMKRPRDAIKQSPKSTSSKPLLGTTRTRT